MRGDGRETAHFGLTSIGCEAMLSRVWLVAHSMGPGREGRYSLGAARAPARAGDDLTKEGMGMSGSSRKTSAGGLRSGSSRSVTRRAALGGGAGVALGLAAISLVRCGDDDHGSAPAPAGSAGGPSTAGPTASLK